MYSLEELKADGFTRRMAITFTEQMEDEKRSGWYNEDYLKWSHSKGFLAESAYAYGLDESNLGRFLSDYDYARLWPLNEWQRMWINDKLTLRYVLAGTEWEPLLAKYYYYITGSGVEAIPGSPFADGVDGLADCIRELGELACKPCNGSRTVSFYRLHMKDGELAVNDELFGVGGLEEFVAGHRNYIVTEYLRPEKSLGKIHPLIHTLRVVVGKVEGSFELLSAYLRFGQTLTGGNYTGSAKDSSNYTVGVDVATGRFGDGKLVYFGRRTESSPHHPTTGVEAAGVLPFWDDVVRHSLGVAESLRFLDYLGFDFGITEEGPRLMEINSHSGVKYLQTMKPIYDIPIAARFFEERLARLNAMGDKEKESRWTIAH